MMFCWIEDAHSRPNFTALRKMLNTCMEEKADSSNKSIILDDIPMEHINDGNEPLI